MNKTTLDYNTVAAVLLLAGVAGTLLTGCMVAGVTSGGHFFLFPGVGVLFVLLVLFLLLRRR